MPSTGTPNSNTTCGARGVSVKVTDSGPPDRIMPSGLKARIASGQGVDSVCCREDLRDKGPGLMFHRFGVDVRRTDCERLDDLLADYFANSEAVYVGETQPPLSR